MSDAFSSRVYIVKALHRTRGREHRPDRLAKLVQPIQPIDEHASAKAALDHRQIILQPVPLLDVYVRIKHYVRFEMKRLAQPSHSHVIPQHKPSAQAKKLPIRWPRA